MILIRFVAIAAILINWRLVSCYFEIFFRHCRKMVSLGRIRIANREGINEKTFARPGNRGRALTTAARLLIETVIISLGCACRSCRREPQKGQSYGQKVSWLNGHADIIFFTYTQIACWLACVSVRVRSCSCRVIFIILCTGSVTWSVSEGPDGPVSPISLARVLSLSNRVNFVNMSRS